jgi:hypothetical protein
VDRELKLLPQEQTYSRVNGVWNLSSEQVCCGKNPTGQWGLRWKMPYMMLSSYSSAF